MTTSIVIPCYFLDQSYVEMTVECLDSLRAFGAPDEIILVDDGSPLRVLFKGYDRRVELEHNGGYAKAVNAGLRAAGGDVIIISNNDIIFNPGWLTELLRPLQEGYDISSIRTSDCDGYTTEDKITEGDKFGSLWAMKRSVYDKLGGLDERYGRGFFEDLDYRRQALNAGFKIAKNHAGLVEHEGHATFKVVDPTDSTYERNKQIYIDKWGFLE